MKYGKLIMAPSEYELIMNLFNRVQPKDVVHKACYDKLRLELTEANIVEESQIPTDVVRLYSYIDVQTPFGRLEDYQLVMPSQDLRDPKKLSILTPMGTALIGYAQGDTVLWNFPVGERQILINRVAQALPKNLRELERK